MKKTLLNLFIILLAITVTAQWQPVSTGLPDFPPTALWPFADTIVLSTYGGGVFKTYDNGDNWVDINGDLGNLFVNNIRGHASYTSMFVATAGGPYYTQDQFTYEDCTSTGLDNTDVTYFGIGDEGISLDNLVGTNGDGIYDSENYTGSWTNFSTGLSEDGLFINDLWGISEGDDKFYILATENGAYIATDVNPTWVEKNNGIAGDALSVQNIVGLGSMGLIATHGGAFMTYDMCETWTPVLLDEKLNTITIVQSPFSTTGFFVFTFGEGGFYSEDFVNFFPLDMTGITGEVTCMASTSTHMFLGVETTSKSGERGLGLYRKPMSFVVGLDESVAVNSGDDLKQNFPNPFSITSTIPFTITEAGVVSLSIFDIQGRLVQTLVNEYYLAGDYTSEVNADNLSEGVYYYSLQTNGNIKLSRKMVVVK